MDAASRRPQLPALSYLDIDKVKREEELYHKRSTGSASSHHSAPIASPSYQYPPGPSPLHSHPPPHHSNTWPGVKSGTHTPPKSRRSSEEEYEHTQHASRQSLPSLSEALGQDKPLYQPSAPTSQPPPPPTHMSFPQPAPPSSPTSSARRSYGIERPQPPNPFSTPNYHQYSSFRQDSLGPQAYKTSDAKPEHASTHDSRVPLQVQTSQFTPRNQHPEPPHSQHGTSPQYDQHSSHSAGPMPPPNAPYGYTSYTSRPGQPTPPLGHTAGPIYQPSSQHAAPTTPSSNWKSENAASGVAAQDRSGPARHGEFVKRHLEIYDFEAALNEVSKYSGAVFDFARVFGDRMHQAPRSGPSLSSLPSRGEIEGMITNAHQQIEYLNKIREVIITQETAYEQQLVEQDQHRKKLQEPAPSQPIVEYHPAAEDANGGFPGSESKKRKTRTNAPGRCHACNRSETPEWRRGPDGARTLCNACGLHFAKQNRKAMLANKAANVDSSNLRPKENV